MMSDRMADCYIADHRGVQRLVLPTSRAWSIRLAVWRERKWNQAIREALVFWASSVAFFMFYVAPLGYAEWKILLGVAVADAIVATMVAVAFRFTPRGDRETLARVMRRCQRCDYRLVESQDSGRCPECGLQFQDEPPPPEVDSIEPPWPGREFRQMIALSVCAYLMAFGCPLVFLPSWRLQVRDAYPPQAYGLIVLVVVQFVIPILLGVITWLIARRVQQVAYSRLSQPARLL